jgi:adenosylcobinamide kinase/adenosylcobinamide-phosphate guanylyltransferase
MARKILLTGGARSGKSHYAQELAETLPQPVLFVATAQPGDEEMRRRIEEHRKARPPAWHTLEVTCHAGRSIMENAGQAKTVIVDCITLLVSNLLGTHTGPDEETKDTQRLERAVDTEMNELADCLRKLDASFIIVTNEVGLGIVPDNKMARLYRDLLGRANQVIARHVNEVYLMVAGIPMPVKTPPGPGKGYA